MEDIKENKSIVKMTNKDIRLDPTKERARTQNVNMDLSNGTDQFKKYEETNEEFPILLIEFESIKEKQETDNWCKNMIVRFKRYPFSRRLKNFRYKDEILYRISPDDSNKEEKLQLCVPLELREPIIKVTHRRYNQTSGT